MSKMKEEPWETDLRHPLPPVPLQAHSQYQPQYRPHHEPPNMVKSEPRVLYQHSQPQFRPQHQRQRQPQSQPQSQYHPQSRPHYEPQNMIMTEPQEQSQSQKRKQAAGEVQQPTKKQRVGGGSTNPANAQPPKERKTPKLAKKKSNKYKGKIGAKLAHLDSANQVANPTSAAKPINSKSTLAKKAEAPKVKLSELNHLVRQIQQGDLWPRRYYYFAKGNSCMTRKAKTLCLKNNRLFFQVFSGGKKVGYMVPKWVFTAVKHMLPTSVSEAKNLQSKPKIRRLYLQNDPNAEEKFGAHLRTIYPFIPDNHVQGIFKFGWQAYPKQHLEEKAKNITKLYLRYHFSEFVSELQKLEAKKGLISEPVSDIFGLINLTKRCRGEKKEMQDIYNKTSRQSDLVRIKWIFSPTDRTRPVEAESATKSQKPSTNCVMSAEEQCGPKRPSTDPTMPVRPETLPAPENVAATSGGAIVFENTTFEGGLKAIKKVEDVGYVGWGTDIIELSDKEDDGDDHGEVDINGGEVDVDIADSDFDSDDDEEFEEPDPQNDEDYWEFEQSDDEYYVAPPTRRSGRLALPTSAPETLSLVPETQSRCIKTEPGYLEPSYRTIKVEPEEDLPPKPNQRIKPEPGSSSKPIQGMNSEAKAFKIKLEPGIEVIDLSD